MAFGSFCMSQPGPNHLCYILDSFRETKERLNPTFQNSQFPCFFPGKRKTFLSQKNSKYLTYTSLYTQPRGLTANRKVFLKDKGSYSALTLLGAGHWPFTVGWG